MELSDRQKQILRAIVDIYVSTAEPVGSKAIAALPDVNCSSATIRNEMADLTQMGLLEQPHTSAGRVPSPAGYRLYIDELMTDYRLSLDETRSLNEALELKSHHCGRAGQAGLQDDGPARLHRGQPPQRGRGQALRSHYDRTRQHHPGADALRRRGEKQADQAARGRHGAGSEAPGRSAERQPDGSHRRGDQRRAAGKDLPQRRRRPWCPW